MVDRSPRPGDHPHAHLARALWDAIAEGDPKKIAQLLDPKAVWTTHGRSALAGTYHGPDEVIGLFARVGELADELEAQLVDILVSDVGAVIRYRVLAQRGSRSLDAEHLVLVRIEGTRVLEAIFAPLDQYLYDRFWTD